MRARARAGVIVAALALAGVLVLAVFPARAYLDQRRHRRELAAQVAQLEAHNRALEDRAATLRTDDEIERLARQYNLARPGEEVYFIPPQPTVPGAAEAAAGVAAGGAGGADGGGPTARRAQPWWSRAWAKVTSVL